MKTSSILSIILIALIITGCKDNPVKPDPPLKTEPVAYDTLIPLSLGNYWLYIGYRLKADGSSGTPDSWKFGFIIDDTLSQVIHGERVMHYKLFSCGEELKPYYDKPGSFEGSKLVYQNRSGLYYAGIEKHDTVKMSFNDLIFPYPPERESSVSGHVFYYSTLGNLFNVPDEVISPYTCVSTDSIITTPLGIFKCIVYRMAYADFEPLFRSEVYYFIKPGLGIVGIFEMAYHYNIQQYTYVRKTLLTEFKIK